jgi:hypothetical protein
MPKLPLYAASLALLLGVTPALAENCNSAGTVGSGGTASAGGTSATTLGTGGTCNTDNGSTGSIASGASAATTDGKTQSRTHIVDNPGKMQAQSKAQAMDKGTFSKSQTKTRVENDQLQSTTRTMSHVPGEKPVKSTSGSQVPVPQQ